MVLPPPCLTLLLLSFYKYVKCLGDFMHNLHFRTMMWKRSILLLAYMSFKPVGPLEKKMKDEKRKVKRKVLSTISG